MSLVGNFSFFPVGQGCFYAGEIIYKGRPYTIVYDCGTVSRAQFLTDSITEFKRNHSKIDLLMISHFDKDHVSGVRDLLTGMTCDKVVIPYYDPLVRLMLLAKHPYDDDYTDFLRDPITYLTESGNVGEVIVLQSGDNDDIAQRAIRKPDSPSPEFDGVFNLEIFGGDNAKNNAFSTMVRNNEQISNTATIAFYTLPTTIVLSGIWEFVFYLKEFNNPEGISDFQDGIDNLLKHTTDGRLQSLFTPTHIKDIQLLYTAHIVGDINYTSLCVYHGPVQRCRSIYLNGMGVVRYSGFMKNDRSGTILTGDSFIKSLADFNLFYNYYSPYYTSQCYFFQVPHHGSQNNWNMLPNRLGDMPFYIINHGYKRKKHPSISVINNINLHSTHKTILSNHQYMRIDYSINAKY